MSITKLPQHADRFPTVFERMTQQILNHCKEERMPDTALSWFEDSLRHNVLGGKYNRGLSVVDSCAILLGRELSETEYFHAAILGWMTEFLQAFFLVTDDIMDDSTTRRGKPCWYKMPNVGMLAINDALMIESTIFILLKTYFKGRDYYMDLVELYHEAAFKTELGQALDLRTTDNTSLDDFSMGKCKFIAICKAAYYSFYLPIVAALHYCKVATPKNIQQANDILIPMGEYFQAQDDYLDAFADPMSLGKIGTDIQDNKCSWLVNNAIPRLDARQRQILEENYGRKNNACEEKVKKLYREVKLHEVYRSYEEAAVSELKEKISKVDESEGLNKEVFSAYLNKIYKREK